LIYSFNSSSTSGCSFVGRPFLPIALPFLYAATPRATYDFDFPYCAPATENDKPSSTTSFTAFSRSVEQERMFDFDFIFAIDSIVKKSTNKENNCEKKNFTACRVW
jgi:hypothetical protein